MSAPWSIDATRWQVWVEQDDPTRRLFCVRNADRSPVRITVTPLPAPAPSAPPADLTPFWNAVIDSRTIDGPDGRKAALVAYAFAVRSAARAEAIREAAQVADSYEERDDVDTPTAIGAAIRALSGRASDGAGE